MCIYCGTNKYRKIYEQHHGVIPTDQDGRTYEIHHIDGNRANNDPKNLKAVSIQEHYDIHYQQEDWAACIRIASRIKTNPLLISELSSKSQKQRIEDGTHHFLSKDYISKTSNRNRLLMKQGNHPFQRKDVIEKISKTSRKTQYKRLADGTHSFLNPAIRELAATKSKETQNELISKGKHIFQDNDLRKQWLEKQFLEGKHPTQDSELQRQKATKRVNNGTHPWIQDGYQTNLNLKLLNEGKHPSQKKIECVHCKQIFDSANFGRWHGDKCKFKSP